MMLMLLPLLGLAAFAVGLQWRERNRKPTSNEPFAYSIEEVKFKRLLSPVKRNWRMEVTVYVGHKGARPSWWGEPNSAHPVLAGNRFIGNPGKMHFQADGGSSGGFDESRQQYFSGLITNTGEKRSVMQPATYVGIVIIKDPSTNRVSKIPFSEVVKDSW